jgi:hypothetical protein
LVAEQTDWADAVVRDAPVSAVLDPVGVRARYASWGRPGSAAAVDADPSLGSTPARSQAHTQAVAVLALAAAAKQTAFCHHARDAAASDRVAIRVTMADIAAAEQDRSALARRRLAELGVDAFSEMTPYLRELAGFDQGPRTDQWWERVLGSFLAHGIAVDAQRILASHLAPASAGLFAGLLEECAGADYLRALLVHAIRGNERRADRLALWGRRVAGDVLGVAVGLIAHVPVLIEILGEDPTFQAQLSAGHSRRMERLGLGA